MSWAQRIEEAPSTGAKLRLLGEALDELQLRAAPAQKTQKLKSISERHLESVDTRRIFEHWRKVMGKNGNSKLTPERRTKVQARLKQGYTVEDILQAIDGCASSDFHMARGQYLGGAAYDDLTLICRDGAKLEFFVALGAALKPANPSAFLG